MPAPSESKHERKPRRRLKASERWMLLYALVGGIACKHIYYDGTARGILNMVGVWLAGGFAMAFALSRLESRVRERRARPASWEAHQLHRAGRRRPEVDPALVWCRRLVFVLVPLVPITVTVWFPIAERDGGSSDDVAVMSGFISFVLAIVLGAFAVADIDRRIAQSKDAWRLARRTQRHPELTAPREVALRPRVVVDPAADHNRIRRRTADGSPLRRRPRNRARLHSALEWTLVVYLVIGLPLINMIFDGPGSFAAFVAIGFALFFLTLRADAWASEAIWTPGNPNAEERKRARIEHGGNWWSVEPPRSLRIVRACFLLFAVVGFFVCLIWPYLNSWSPSEKYPYVAVYLGGFLAGLAWLGYAERRQCVRENEWLERRKAERHAARSTPS